MIELILLNKIQFYGEKYDVTKEHTILQRKGWKYREKYAFYNFTIVL